MAAGSEGLWQYEMENLRGYSSYLRRSDENLVQISTLNCSACEWSYYSIFCSSYETGGYLADFSFARPQTDATAYENDEPISLSGPSASEFQPFEGRVREFEEIVPAERIFDSPGYAWGCKDKVCQSSDATIHVAKYKPWADESHDRLRRLADVRLRDSPGTVVSAALAVFGTVIEFDDGLIVLRSDGEQIAIPGEPVNWRVFPRSKHYANHLHIVYNNHLEVLSFNHDYFLDQVQKQLGITMQSAP